jgi:hypothetical protein
MQLLQRSIVFRILLQRLLTALDDLALRLAVCGSGLGSGEAKHQAWMTKIIPEHSGFARRNAAREHECDDESRFECQFHHGGLQKNPREFLIRV